MRGSRLDHSNDQKPHLRADLRPSQLEPLPRPNPAEQSDKAPGTRHSRRERTSGPLRLKQRTDLEGRERGEHSGNSQGFRLFCRLLSLGKGAQASPPPPLLKGRSGRMIPEGSGIDAKRSDRPPLIPDSQIDTEEQTYSGLGERNG